MILAITKAAAANETPIPGLPDGGIIKGAATTSFTLVSTALWDRVRPAIEALKDAGTITYSVRPHATTGDMGERVWQETLRVQHSDLTAEAVTETVEDTFTFPAGAVLVGAKGSLDVLFAGGAVSACTVDSGIAAAEADVIHDALVVFTGQDLGVKYPVGTNTAAEHPIDLGGKKLRIKVTTTDANVDALTAGDLTVTAYYVIL